MRKKYLKNQSIVAIISSYNRGDKIKQTIDSLLNQSTPITKIIVIDDASEPTKSVPLFRDKRVEQIKLKKNVGVVWGRNLGLSKVGSFTYVLLIDDDISLEKNAIQKMIECFNSKADAVCIMPTVYFLGNKKRVWSAGSGVQLLTGQTLFNTEKPIEIESEIYAATSVLLAKVEAIKTAGWYDPLYYFCYEDADFYYRIREKNNGKIYAARDAAAYHDIPEDLSLQRVALRSYHIARGRVLFLSRHSMYFPFNLPFVLAYSLYYFYLGFQFSAHKAGALYIEGFVDGVKLWIHGYSRLTAQTNFTDKLDLSKIKSPIFLKSTKVRT